MHRLNAKIIVCLLLDLQQVCLFKERFFKEGFLGRAGFKEGFRVFRACGREKNGWAGARAKK